MKKSKIIKPLTKEEKAKYGRMRTSGEELWFKILKDSKGEKMKTRKVRKTSKKDQKDRKIEALETKLKDTQCLVGVLFVTLVVTIGVLLFRNYKDSYRNAVKTSCKYLELEVKDHPKIRWVNYDIFNETCTVSTRHKDGLLVFGDYDLKETELLRVFFSRYGTGK